MAAPPAMKFATICLVTSAGYAETPRAATPWLPAKTATRARSSRGGWRASQRQSHCVNSSGRPTPRRGAPGNLAEASRTFPLVGVVVGAISAMIYAAAVDLGLTAILAAALSVGAGIVATGALHEDGLADVADGLGARGDSLA